MNDKTKQGEQELEVAREPVVEGTPSFDATEHITKPAQDDPPPRSDDPQPVVDSSVDREAIAQRFAQRRAESAQPFTGDMRDPVLRGGVAALPQTDPEPADPPADQTSDTPSEARESGPSDSQEKLKRKIVVRREEREVDEDELIRLAQIGAANEGYVNEARQLLEETKRVVSSRPHPGAEPDDADASDADDGQPHPADPFKTVVEKMQFGDTAEAAEALRTTTAQTTDEAARKAVYAQQRQLDVGRATRAYDSFRESNADLLKDPIAETAMERIYHDELRADLRKLGYPDDKIPKNRDALVETHRFHRIHGQPVRETTELLKAAKDGFTSWRGTGQQQPAPAPSTSKVAVNVDRTERRQNIPQQPSRAAVPQTAPAKPTSQTDSRKDAVTKMRQARGQVVSY